LLHKNDINNAITFTKSNTLVSIQVALLDSRQAQLSLEPHFSPLFSLLSHRCIKLVDVRENATTHKTTTINERWLFDLKIKEWQYGSKRRRLVFFIQRRRQTTLHNNTMTSIEFIIKCCRHFTNVAMAAKPSVRTVGFTLPCVINDAK
jgi:hypothetical protein